jgi:hypothetical protein
MSGFFNIKLTILKNYKKQTITPFTNDEDMLQLVKFRYFFTLQCKKSFKITKSDNIQNGVLGNEEKG